MTPKKVIDKTGRPPGWLQYTGSRQDKDIRASQFTYSASVVEGGDLSPDKIDITCQREGMVCWTDIRGLHNEKMLEELGGDLGLSRLVMEDMLNVSHPPKLDVGPGFVFLSLKHLDPADRVTETHVNLILTNDKVFSISDTGKEVFLAVRDRLLDEQNKLRSFGADHLFLRLADLITDHYLPYLNILRDQFDVIQERLIQGEEGEILHDIMKFRKSLITLRQTILPLRTAFMELQSLHHELISEGAYPYLRDVLEHLNQAAEEHRSLSDAVPVLLELHHANISNRMNAVMKTLTVVASIFIPLTFLAGIYGMNFQHMPELGYPWAYPALLGIMVLVALGMIWYMRRKRWL